ncbi:MAG: respiratory nitrate reductase subunit gamma [Actinobacteria bacterium]|nr:respiratory nitrate reductase subunit gamma [Actinomycetota bacterium]MBI3688600.1 respiratory nitrate reductase subunit gamma [Actinomycetota bacterium]
MNTVLWVVLPYICLTSFVVGHFWRYRYDKFGWTTRSSQIYENRLLAWAGPLFHFGILGVLVGHALGLLVPESWTSAAGISEDAYHAVSVSGGTLAGLMTVTGLVLLVYRRRMTPSIFRATTVMDKAMYLLLGAVVAVGTYNTLVINLLGAGHDYRADVAVWFRSIFVFQPDAALMAGAPIAFQLHALLALGLFALWPFTRLVHVFSAPVGYLVRPYIVYRSRDPLGAARAPRRGWERVGS